MRLTLLLAPLTLLAPACRSGDAASTTQSASPAPAFVVPSPSPPSPPSPSPPPSPPPSPSLAVAPSDPSSPPASSFVFSSFAPAPDKPIAIGKGTRVLVVGDSTAPTFSLRMKRLVEEAGGSLAHDYWPGSTTVVWAHHGRLRRALDQHKPDVVFVVLGSNEVFAPFPDAIAPHVRALVAKLAPRGCAWIGPPLWSSAKRRGKAIVGVHRENAAPCAFFDSSKLKLPRWEDGIHPTIEGGRAWVEAAWEALVRAKIE